MSLHEPTHITQHDDDFNQPDNNDRTQLADLSGRSGYASSDHSQHRSSGAISTDDRPQRHRRNSRDLIRKLKDAASSVGQKIQNTKEFLSDQELRKMGAGIVRRGVEKGAKIVGKGIETGRQTIQQGPKQLSKILEKLQERLKEQHWERQLIIQKDEPVDIQIAHKLYENAPQQLRTNLWMAFLENSELCDPLKNLYAERIFQTNLRESKLKVSSFKSESLLVTQSEDIKMAEDNIDCKQLNEEDTKQQYQFLDQLWGVYQTVELDSIGGSTEEQEGGQDLIGISSDKNIVNQQQQQDQNYQCQRSESQQLKEQLANFYDIDKVNNNAGGNTKQNLNNPEISNVQQNLIDMSTTTNNSNDNNNIISVEHDFVDVMHETDSKISSPSNNNDDNLNTTLNQTDLIDINNSDSNSNNTNNDDTKKSNVKNVETQDDWELVQEGEWDKQTGKFASFPGGASPITSPTTEAELETERKIMNPLMEVVFMNPHGENEFQEIPPDSQYATLLQISIGQEIVEEVISRDIKRTYPEVPQFELEQTQTSLYNLLKAYALHDLEVGYCQGMAFVAGLILMYLPEEPAFRLYCQLMDSKQANLRKYYMPDLQGLKDELEKFELLVRKYLPMLFTHLQDQGALAVLYAAPWFMTSFAACLPSTHAARIIDIMLISKNDDILHQLGLAILFEIQRELMQLDNMEPLCNYIKQVPGSWPIDRFRKVFKKAQSLNVELKIADQDGILEFEFQDSLMDAMSGGIERAQSLHK